ncbi:DNA polymerase III subunit delta' [Streptomyces sp. WMMC500]|uniref:DNA polymerase III subunit delta' n=1 Tax=Streptomyces sp. WMMC500 TaxID=3015154 RepID=UPI00248BBE62|nr:DNA polymerase III subunit delta' [Streptomyces sp. WMMC500]WBB58300.1 DNA polymerase III subunit delta' [Streptomyces sp. WMMC500]
MTVWDELVGQERVGEQLAAAARAADARVTAEAGQPASASAPGDASDRPSTSAMTHAWLFTGPPGAGLATTARAFAAALQCVSPDRAAAGPGCGFCDGCHTALVGTHADVTVIATDLLTIGVKETRDLVRRAQLAPSGGRWQVIVVEDADRLTEGAGNVLLKAVEEPAPRTVWLLCAPSLEDVLPTIRSRCRHLSLSTPAVAAVAAVLVHRDGVTPAVAESAARAAGGHLDRARRLATDDRARARRAAVLRIPLRVEDIGGCLRAAQELVDVAADAAKERAEELDEQETEEMRTALGAQPGGRMPRGTAGVMKDLQERQKRRATRSQRDSLDLALTDLAGFYRDVLALQLGAVADASLLPCADVGEGLRRIAEDSGPEMTLRRIDAIMECREALERNVAPLLALEAMTVTLRKP